MNKIYHCIKGGGLSQLVAYGAQDIYLTGNPQITFSKLSQNILTLLQSLNKPSMVLPNLAKNFMPILKW